MVMVINKAVIEQVFGTEDRLRAQIVAYQTARIKHAKTINKPAPRAHGLVEQLVLVHGGQFQVEVDEHELPPDVAEQFEPILPPEPPVLTLDEMKLDVRMRLVERREDRVVEGVVVDGHRFSGHTYHLSLLLAVLAVPGPILVEWMDADYKFVPMDRPALENVLRQLVAMITACYANEKRIATKIFAAPTEQKLKLITLEDGWPA